VSVVPANQGSTVAATSGWLERLDDWCERLGDSLNPILVKETRQALKSRQFVMTFSALLFASLAWTIIGSLFSMPQIYTSPTAPRMLIGYYVVLALPMLLVVPLAAYRSLEGEIDDGTLELLSITALSPWQIVLGKLASAMLQMVLYYVALFPCVAYAYTLRGVDLPTTMLMMAILVVAAILLTVIALFFAPLSRTRTGRISTLLAVMSILLLSNWGLAALVITMILYGNPLSAEELFFSVIASLLISVSLGHLLLTATAAQLMPESENRSTHMRLSLMVLTSVVLGLAALSIQTLQQDAVAVAVSLAAALAMAWTICGSLMAAESSIVTPRIRRELPSSFLARCTLTWLTPGPATGLVFATVNIIVVTWAVVYGIEYVFDQPGVFSRPTFPIMLKRFSVAFAAYLVGFLVAIRVVIGIVRIKNNPRVELGLAALIAVAVLTALVPYSIGLHFNDYRPYSYNNWQITNWVWTMGEILRGRNLEGRILAIAVTVTFGFFACLLTMPHLVLPRRTATPQRVKAELDAIKHA
jgi:ABC-type transport system involved in multi-copper enzyme maturation permease subunit